MQEDVALFASELFQLKAQVICTKFQPSTILQYAAASAMQPADQALIPQALQLIQDKPLRSFRIQVDADSLVQIDEQQNKRDRTEFLQAMGGFLTQALPMGQQAPELVPMLIELVKFGVSAYKKAAPIEGTIDQAMQEMQKKQQMMANQPPPPNPEVIKMESEASMKQAQMESETAMKQAEIEAEDRRAKLDASTRIMVARLHANPGVDIPYLEEQVQSAKNSTMEIGQTVSNSMQQMQMELNQNMSATMQQMQQVQMNLANMIAQTMSKIDGAVGVMAAPKRIVRGADGKAIGVEVIQ
jgi:hypothetical protein